MNHSVETMNRSISILYRYAQISITRRLQERGMAIGNGQYPYILAVCDHPGIRQDHLTGRLYYNKSSVARSIAALERNGYLRRETDPEDKRVYRVYPTRQGLAAKPLIGEQLRAVVAEFTAGFRPEEVVQLGDLLLRAAGNVADSAQKPSLLGEEAASGEQAAGNTKGKDSIA